MTLLIADTFERSADSPSYHEGNSGIMIVQACQASLPDSNKSTSDIIEMVACHYLFTLWYFLNVAIS